MNRIKILPEHVANKIAAGEVVERPASVVKELIENALDAGASRITVETEAGGVGLIRVSDDGCGMSREDAMLALERHATSKISGVDDIGRIQTLGFRGEALPSIASVCRFELTTKEKEAQTAVALAVEGGKIQSSKEAAHQNGTTIVMRDLFFNIPARRKFLKSHTTENAHIAQVIRLAALSAQKTGFRWICDNEETITIAPHAALKDRVAALFEAEIAEGLMPVDKSFGMLRVHGLTGKATLTRSARNHQFFFVNGRPVQNKTLSFALKEAYHSLVMVERQPVCFLFLDMPAADVDVNVHPSKREVRFRQDSMMRDAVIQAVRQTVSGKEDSPSIMPYAPAMGADRDDRVREAMALYETRSLADTSRGEDQRWPAADHAFIQAAVQQAFVPEKPSEMRLIGQIHKLFLLLESPEGLVILDQHAAHERILYDQVMKKMREAKTVESQKLLLPETISCDAAQTRLLSQCLPDLARMGMEMREFGKNAFVVEAVPFFMRNSDIKSMLQDVLDDLMDQQKSSVLGRAQEEMVLLTLCRIAVRGADALHPREQQALVDQWLATENPFHCPHGRPTMLKLSKDYLSRQFKRI